MGKGGDGNEGASWPAKKHVLAHIACSMANADRLEVVLRKSSGREIFVYEMRSTKAELEDRIDLLERQFAILEKRVRNLPRSVESGEIDDDERDRVRLQHILRILRRFNGSASLDEIARENDSLTKAGTRAQLVRLIGIGAVEQPSRGRYALVRGR